MLNKPPGLVLFIVLFVGSLPLNVTYAQSGGTLTNAQIIDQISRLNLQTNLEQSRVKSLEASKKAKEAEIELNRLEEHPFEMDSKSLDSSNISVPSHIQNSVNQIPAMTIPSSSGFPIKKKKRSQIEPVVLGLKGKANNLIATLAVAKNQTIPARVGDSVNGWKILRIDQNGVLGHKNQATKYFGFADGGIYEGSEEQEQPRYTPSY